MKTLEGAPKISPEKAANVLAGPTDVGYVLLGAAAVAVVPPAGANFAVFSTEQNLAVDWEDGQTAVYPTVSAASADAPEVILAGTAIRYIGDRFITTLFASPNFSLIGPTAGICSISFYI